MGVHCYSTRLHQTSQKLGVSGVKETVKTNKDLGMSCYIQVEYVYVFIGTSLVTMYKLFYNINYNITEYQLYNQ